MPRDEKGFQAPVGKGDPGKGKEGGPGCSPEEQNPKNYLGKGANSIYLEGIVNLSGKNIMIYKRVTLFIRDVFS